VVSVGVAGCAGVRGATTAAVNGHTPNSDEVRLIVSRNFGTQVMHDEIVRWQKGLNVMTLLAQRTRVGTAYGGEFVNAIDGLRSTFGGVSSAKAADWFYWVDGVLADVGASSYQLHGGDTVWWDYHEWANAMSIPATLSAFPAPWTGYPVAVAADNTWPGLQTWARTSGLTLGTTTSLGAGPASGGIVVATLQEVMATSWLRQLLQQGDGIRLVNVVSGQTLLVSPAGVRGPHADAVALAFSDEQSSNRLLLVLLADSTPAAERLFTLLTPRALAGHVGVALVNGKLLALPWQAQ
jgi:hypothetical protein